MRTLIVDDEAPARERLKRLLTSIGSVELVGEAGDGAQTVEMIGTLSPDLVLLDIQMPNLDGLGAIHALADPPAIVFVTAYDEHALAPSRSTPWTTCSSPSAGSDWKRPSAALGTDWSTMKG